MIDNHLHGFCKFSENYLIFDVIGNKVIILNDKSIHLMIWQTSVNVKAFTAVWKAESMSAAIRISFGGLFECK